MPSRLGHGLYKKIDRLKNIFRCIYIIRRSLHTGEGVCVRGGAHAGPRIIKAG